jgi:hypothetical protein
MFAYIYTYLDVMSGYLHVHNTWEFMHSVHPVIPHAPTFDTSTYVFTGQTIHVAFHHHTTSGFNSRVSASVEPAVPFV